MRLLHGFGLRGKLTRWRWCNFRQRPFPANVRVADDPLEARRKALRTIALGATSAAKVFRNLRSPLLIQNEVKYPKCILW